MNELPRGKLQGIKPCRFRIALYSNLSNPCNLRNLWIKLAASVASGWAETSIENFFENLRRNLTLVDFTINKE